MTASKPMTAQLQCTKKGGPFEVVQVPRPMLAPKEVLIQQRVIALNLLDVKQRDLGLGVSHWPRVFGIEGAGVIEEVGSQVHDLHPGDEVAAWEGSGALEKVWGGAFQECVTVQTHFVAKKPKNISLEEAASLPCV